MNPRAKPKEEATGLSGKRPPDETETMQAPPQCSESSGFWPVCKGASGVSLMSKKEFIHRSANVINDGFAETQLSFLDGVRRAFGMGAVLFFIQEEGRLRGVIPHGEFQTWLSNHCAQVPWRTVRDWKAMARGAVETLLSVGFDFSEVDAFICNALGLQNGNALPLEIPHRRYLCLYLVAFFPDRELPEPLRKLAAAFNNLIEGKSRKQLFLEFKGATEDKNGELIDKRSTGDKQWEQWMWEFHVERIAEGKVPTRREAEDLVDEYEAYLKKKTAPLDPIKKVEGARSRAAALWAAKIADLRVLRRELHYLDNQSLDRILDALVETSNFIREMRHPKGGTRGA